VGRLGASVPASLRSFVTSPPRFLFLWNRGFLGRRILPGGGCFGPFFPSVLCCTLTPCSFSFGVRHRGGALGGRWWSLVGGCLVGGGWVSAVDGGGCLFHFSSFTYRSRDTLISLFLVPPSGGRFLSSWHLLVGGCLASLSGVCNFHRVRLQCLSLLVLLVPVAGNKDIYRSKVTCIRIKATTRNAYSEP